MKNEIEIMNTMLSKKRMNRIMVMLGDSMLVDQIKNNYVNPILSFNPISTSELSKICPRTPLSQ